MFGLIDRALLVIVGKAYSPLMRDAYGRDGFTVITKIVGRRVGKSSLWIILKTKERAKARYMAFVFRPLLE